MGSDGKSDLKALTVGIRLGQLPVQTVDAMFAGLTTEALCHPSMSARAAVAARFAAAKEEAEIMSDGDVNPKTRLQAAKQFADGILDICKLYTAREIAAPTSKAASDAGGSVTKALEEVYGNENS